MEEIIERIQDEIFLIFMLISTFSLFLYIITEKLSFISSFLSLTISLIAINKDIFIVYTFLFIIIGIISFISMLDIDMWMEMEMSNMNKVQKIIRLIITLIVIIPVIQILYNYSFFQNFKLNFRSVFLSFASLVFIILSAVIIPRYILVFISRIKSHKKITSFFIIKALRYRLFYGMTQSKLQIRDGVNEYMFEVSNRAYKILRKKTYVKIQMLEGHFGCYYVKNNFLGKDRLKTLKEDLPRFLRIFMLIIALGILFVLFCHIVANYAWIG